MSDLMIKLNKVLAIIRRVNKSLTALTVKHENRIKR